jgi:hypothetical protein
LISPKRSRGKCLGLVIWRLNPGRLLPYPGTGHQSIRETEIAARALKVRLIRFPVRGPEDYESIFRVVSKERAHGLVVRIPVFTPSAQRKQILEFAAKNRLPAIYRRRPG